jgi:hypothetical protein
MYNMHPLLRITQLAHRLQHARCQLSRCSVLRLTYKSRDAASVVGISSKQRMLAFRSGKHGTFCWNGCASGPAGLGAAGEPAAARTFMTPNNTSNITLIRCRCNAWLCRRWECPVGPLGAAEPARSPGATLRMRPATCCRGACSSHQTVRGTTG